MIDRECPDLTVFLGDYFDSFGDVLAETRRTVKWLKTSLEKPRRAHLLGNHDISYFWPSDATFCPGWTSEKQRIIARVLDLGDVDKFKFHAWVDGWLLTHAGLARHWVPPGVEIVSWLDEEAKKARSLFLEKRVHWFVAIGRARGGYDPAGGLVWCDWREERWPIRQLVGHTPSRDVRTANNGSVCLDTNIGSGPRKYAVIVNGSLTVQNL